MAIPASKYKHGGGMRVVEKRETGYEGRMMRCRQVLFFAVLLITVTGCSALPDPYIYRPNEFNRTAAGFGREPENISEVTVCYNIHTATPKQVRRMAEAECAKYGKNAKFRRQTVLNCQLFNPISAEYTCGPTMSGGSQRSEPYPWSYIPGDSRLPPAPVP